MREYLIVCDYREKFESFASDEDRIYNDHYKLSDITELIQTINELGYKCEFFGGVDELLEAKKYANKYNGKIFLNFNDGLTHKHKRGQTPILLEMITNLYSGSDTFTSLLTSDKYSTNMSIAAANIAKIPKSIYVNSIYDLLEDNITMEYPLIIKPNNEGSSIGISQENYICNFTELKKQFNLLRNKFDSFVIEEYISGFEVTSFLVGNDNFLINQPILIGCNDSYYFERYIIGMDEKLRRKRNFCVPSKVLSSKQISSIKNVAVNIFKHLGMRDFGRIDFRIHGDEIFLIEANTVPAISKTSDVGALCTILGITYKDFVSKLLSAINSRLFHNT